MARHQHRDQHAVAHALGNGEVAAGGAEAHRLAARDGGHVGDGAGLPGVVAVADHRVHLLRAGVGRPDARDVGVQARAERIGIGTGQRAARGRGHAVGGHAGDQVAAGDAPATTAAAAGGKGHRHRGRGTGPQEKASFHCCYPLLVSKTEPRM